MKETLLAYFRMPGTWAGFVSVAAGLVSLKWGDEAGQAASTLLLPIGGFLIGVPR
ncbi:MAG: hypothetical protein AB3X46_09210 [Leptothrix ochracea]|uniref:hypothetical protein n=1 Tax=Leptothrix ochracea TaxID=735331 RepID=UPI0034E1F944